MSIYTDSQNTYLNKFSKTIIDPPHCYRNIHMKTMNEFLENYFGNDFYNLQNDLMRIRIPHPKETAITQFGDNGKRFSMGIKSNFGSPLNGFPRNGISSAIEGSGGVGYAQMTSFENLTKGDGLIDQSTDLVYFAVISDVNINIAVFEVQNSQLVFLELMSCGWLDDPYFDDDNIYRFANCYMLKLNASTVLSENGFVYRPEENGITIFNSILKGGEDKGNYGFSCFSDSGDGTTPLANWCNHFALIDGASSPIGALGSVRNLLLVRGNFQPLKLYRVKNVGAGKNNINPNTEQEGFLCLRQYGTLPDDYLLMRVYTEGFKLT